ncbi:MAG: DUF2332 domain-containing protein [Dehalococcoidia bacterium]|nr:DUF2332 domain-containing protein [Dehalococcoidia bacterium]
MVQSVPDGPPTPRHSFRNWSDIEAVANLSPLYQLLGNAVASDEELLDLAAEALPGQPPPNVLFAAVHARLAQHLEHPLAVYYGTLGGSRAAAPEAVGLFREFCISAAANSCPLFARVSSRLTKSAVGRLAPRFASVAEDAGQPLALFEIGPSAGLNLLFDRYRYRYGTTELGSPESPVLLVSEPRGAPPAVLMPAVASRLGIDINPLDVRDRMTWPGSRHCSGRSTPTEWHSSKPPFRSPANLLRNSSGVICSDSSRPASTQLRRTRSFAFSRPSS